MHPYEVALTLRTRAKHESIRLNFGSLYSVVEGLERRLLISAKETVRSGRRPERTVYEITEAGRRELVDWLSELVAVPEKEYLQFEAALTLLAALPPEDAVALLRERAEVLDRKLTVSRALRADLGIPRVHLIEMEYVERLLEAELTYVRELVSEIDAGTLEGLEVWRSFHWAAGDPPSPDPLPADHPTEGDQA